MVLNIPIWVRTSQVLPDPFMSSGLSTCFYALFYSLLDCKLFLYLYVSMSILLIPTHLCIFLGPQLCHKHQQNTCIATALHLSRIAFHTSSFYFSNLTLLWAFLIIFVHDFKLKGVKTPWGYIPLHWPWPSLHNTTLLFQFLLSNTHKSTDFNVWQPTPI